MRVLVYEDNLIWSSRLVQALKGLGHEAVLITDSRVDSGDAAIVNLSSPRLQPRELVSSLIASGVKVVGHAGHKEKDLHEMGRAAGCLYVASNSELSFKLDLVLERVAGLPAAEV